MNMLKNLVKNTGLLDRLSRTCNTAPNNEPENFLAGAFLDKPAIFFNME